jgi:hypothetical protein
MHPAFVAATFIVMVVSPCLVAFRALRYDQKA